VIELYAIAAHPGPPLPPLAQLRAVASGELAAVCAPAGQEELTPDALWRHEEVVEALMETRDVLPVRYGTRLPDEQAAAAVIEERREELRASLERVRGAVELSVRALASDGSHEAGGSGDGAEYLRQRARAEEARDLVRAEVHEPLTRMAREGAVRSVNTPAELLRAAYLVDRASVREFAALVARLDESHPRLSLLCTGPWPPYSFVTR
jgi:gas vesicle protein GvpL/GvpF